MPVFPLSSRRYINYLAYSLISIALMLMLLPQLVSHGLVYGLGRIGAGAVSVDNIDLNLFTGRLAVDELQIYQSGARVFRLGHGELEVDWHTLWRKRLQLHELVLQNLSVTIEQPSADRLRIAGMPLPQSEATTNTDKASATPWGIGYENVSLQNVTLDFIRPGLSQSVGIRHLSSGPLHSWEGTATTPVKVQLAMNGATLAVDASIRPFAPSPQFDLTLQLTPLELATLRPLLPAALPSIRGQLRLDARSTLRITSGEFSADISARLNTENLTLTLPENNLTLSSSAVDWQGSTQLALKKGELRLSSSGDLSLQQIAASTEGGKTPHTRLKRLQLSGLEVHNLQDIQLNEIHLAGLQTTLRQSANGLAPVSQHQTTATTDTPTATAPQGPGLRLRVNAIRLDGDNRIHFIDTTTSPRFEQDITIQQLSLGPIDTQSPSVAEPFTLQAMLGNHSRLSAEGELTPLTQPPGVTLKLTMANYEMPPLSPYLVRQLGYKINSGQLDSKVQLSIDNNAMAGKVQIKARQLEMEPEDPARIKEFEQQSSMPIKTALGLLRDDDNNISLEIPLSGNLSDPKFDFSQAINTALANTMRTAAVSYLKYLLQPFGSIITLAQMAGKAGGSVQLEPIVFAAGSTEPDTKMENYIQKLAALFQKRNTLQLRLCGIATTSDLLALSKGERKTIPAEGDEQLEALARQRAENIKNIMVDRYGVSASQLFICHPSLEGESGAHPRVRLQF